MLISKVRAVFAILSFMFIVSSVAVAKDKVLLERMIELEQAYIPAVFFTSDPEKFPFEKANGSFKYYKKSWSDFSADYKYYRSSDRNWTSYFDKVDYYIAKAETFLSIADTLSAHKELEFVRTTMRELRRRNGFPKFATDELTAFHSIMGNIIGITTSLPEEKYVDIDTIEILYDLYEDASHAWFKVEKNNIDFDVWGVYGGKVDMYNMQIDDERDMLNAFEEALHTEETDIISGAANNLKMPQAIAYLILGGVK